MFIQTSLEKLVYYFNFCLLMRGKGFRKYVLMIAALPGLFCHNTRAQTYPTGYFIKPMDTAIYLAGTFGTLRENHFHSGMDIRTYEQEGYPVKAAADGYVVRIKVSPYGYGKAVYINHPNGYTTVYGHLQRYNDTITSYINRIQYQRESFDVDVMLKPGEIPVKKGDIIALSGNSGGSSGPHLHFEIRHTLSEEIIDPMFFNVGFADTLPPKINSVFFFDLDRSVKKKLGYYLPAKPINNNGRIRQGDTVKLATGTYGLGASMEDFFLLKDWGLGCNHFTLQVDGRLVYKCDINRFHFDETRYLNLHLDYYTLRKTGARIHRLFVDQGNRIGFYSNLVNRGMITLSDTTTYKIMVKAYDLQGRSDSFFCYMRGVPPQPFVPLISKLKKGEKIVAPPPKEPSKNEDDQVLSKQYVIPNRKESVRFPLAKLTIPVGVLYDTLLLTYKLKPVYKGVTRISLGNAYIPLHANAELSLKITSTPSGKPEQWCIARVFDDGSRSYCGGEVGNGWINARVRALGDFIVTSDVDAPRIKPLSASLRGWPLSDSLIAFTISDNFSGISQYRCTINGKWLLMDYDAKNDWLTGYLPELPPGRHELILTVTDDRKNTSTFKTQLIVP